jgi:hypothetical protein
MVVGLMILDLYHSNIFNILGNIPRSNRWNDLPVLRIDWKYGNSPELYHWAVLKDIAQVELFLIGLIFSTMQT